MRHFVLWKCIRKSEILFCWLVSSTQRTSRFHAQGRSLWTHQMIYIKYVLHVSSIYNNLKFPSWQDPLQPRPNIEPFTHGPKVACDPMKTLIYQHFPSLHPSLKSQHKGIHTPWDAPWFHHCMTLLTAGQDQIIKVILWRCRFVRLQTDGKGEKALHVLCYYWFSHILSIYNCLDVRVGP